MSRSLLLPTKMPVLPIVHMLCVAIYLGHVKLQSAAAQQLSASSSIAKNLPASEVRQQQIRTAVTALCADTLSIIHAYDALDLEFLNSESGGKKWRTPFLPSSSTTAPHLQSSAMPKIDKDGNVWTWKRIFSHARPQGHPYSGQLTRCAITMTKEEIYSIWCETHVTYCTHDHGYQYKTFIFDPKRDKQVMLCDHWEVNLKFKNCDRSKLAKAFYANQDDYPALVRCNMDTTIEDMIPESGETFDTSIVRLYPSTQYVFLYGSYKAIHFFERVKLHSFTDLAQLQEISEAQNNVAHSS